MNIIQFDSLTQMRRNSIDKTQKLRLLCCKPPIGHVSLVAVGWTTLLAPSHFGQIYGTISKNEISIKFQL